MIRRSSVPIVPDVVRGTRGGGGGGGGCSSVVLGLECKQRVQRVRYTLTGRAGRMVVVLVVMVVMVIVLIEAGSGCCRGGRRRGVVGLRGRAARSGAVAEVERLVAAATAGAAHADGARVAVVALLEAGARRGAHAHAHAHAHGAHGGGARVRGDAAAARERRHRGHGGRVLVRGRLLAVRRCARGARRRHGERRHRAHRAGNNTKDVLFIYAV